MVRVVVIGAGTAGLTVAKQLSAEPNFQVTLIEAMDRIGGRIKTVEFKNEAARSKNQKADLGASWMHESRANPLFDIALQKKWGLKYTDVNVQYGNDQGPIPQSEGVLPIIDDLQAQIEDYVLCNPAQETDNITVKDFTEKCVEKMPLVTDKQKQLALQLSHKIEHFIAVPWAQIPLSDGILSDVHGRDAFVLGAGFSQVIDWLWKGIDYSKTELKLNEEVVEIKKTGDGGFTVETNHAEYPADYVVCTIPVGALKLCHERLFKSLQIPDIISSVKQTNMGTLGKVFVEFSNVFWDKSRDITFAISNSNETQNGEPTTLTLVTPFNDLPVVMVLTAPPFTQVVESDPENAWKHISWAFKHLGTNEVPEPTNVIVSDWTTNRFITGSYSARSVGQSYDEFVLPFIEGADNLRFAGEHTTLEGNGCVHAAYNSGIREAAEILLMEKAKN